MTTPVGGVGAVDSQGGAGLGMGSTVGVSTPAATRSPTSSDGVYHVPTSVPASTTGGYSFNPDDPYNLGTLAKEPIIVGVTQGRTYTEPSTDPTDRGPHGTYQPPGASHTYPGQPTGIAHETATQYMTDFLKLYGSNRTEYDALRTALADAGYYGSESLDRITGRSAGQWDVVAMRNAIKDWYTYTHSTSSPMTLPDWLRGSTQNPNTAAQPGGSQAIPRVMDPAQIRTAAQNAAQQALGKGLSEKQLQQFVQQFQAEQLSNQDDPYTTSYKLPGEAMSFAQNADPADYRQNQAQTFANTLINMFAPTASQRPNMTPTPTA